MGLTLRIVVWALMAVVFLIAFASLIFVSSAAASRLIQRLRGGRTESAPPNAFDNDGPVA